MALLVQVRKVGKARWVKMHSGKNTEADWMDPTYARRLAKRLLKAASIAEKGK